MTVSQDVVGHCMELFKDNQARISAIEAHLMQYGYKPQPGHTAVHDPMQLLEASGVMCLAVKIF